MIAVGSDLMFIALPTKRSHQPVQTFSCFSKLIVNHCRSVQLALERRTIQWEAALAQQHVSTVSDTSAVRTASSHATELVSMLQQRNERLTAALHEAVGQLREAAGGERSAMAAAEVASGDAQHLRRQLAEAEAAAEVAAADARAACFEAFGVS